MRAIRHLFVGLSLLAASATAVHAADTPDQLVRDTIEKLRAAIVNEKDVLASNPNRAVELVDQIVSPHVDTARASKLILGKHWRTATPEQRQQFTEAFKDMLLRTYAVHASSYTDVHVTFFPSQETSQEDQGTVVRTQVTRPGGQPASVDYRMDRTPEGWKVFDVVVNGVSVVATLRSTVSGEIQKGGLDALIAQLRAKRDVGEGGGT